MTHFVYVWVKKPAIWQELLHSIRSIQLNFIGEKKIFVVGDNPKIRNVIHVPCSQITNVKHAKALDSIKKLTKIVNTPQINDDFVYMYDDIILLKKTDIKPFKVILARDYPKKMAEYFKRGHKPSPHWYNTFTKTIRQLKSEGLPVWDYETHLPRIYNKEKVRAIIDKYNLNESPYLFNTLYFNNYCPAPDTSLIKSPHYKAEVYHAYKYKYIEKMCFPKLFMNYNNAGLNSELQKFIKDNF